MSSRNRNSRTIQPWLPTFELVLVVLTVLLLNFFRHWIGFPFQSRWVPILSAEFDIWLPLINTILAMQFALVVWKLTTRRSSDPLKLFELAIAMLNLYIIVNMLMGDSIIGLNPTNIAAAGLQNETVLLEAFSAELLNGLSLLVRMVLGIAAFSTLVDCITKLTGFLRSDLTPPLRKA